MKDPLEQFYNQYDWFYKKPKLKGQTMKKETLQKIIDTSNILAIPMATAAGIWWTSFDVGAYVLGTFALLNSVCEYLKLFCKK